MPDPLSHQCKSPSSGNRAAQAAGIGSDDFHRRYTIGALVMALGARYLWTSCLGSSSIIIRMSSIRKLAAEAADNGLLAPELAAGIARVKSAKSVGVRAGNWLSLKQAQTLLNAPDGTTAKGLRDRAILAVLLGCGLRRSEVAALTFRHIHQRDGRWCIVDLKGKHGRIRTIPMPTWVKVAIDAWTSVAAAAEGWGDIGPCRDRRCQTGGMSKRISQSPILAANMYVASW